MSKSSQTQVPPHALFQKTPLDTPPDHPKLSDRYILVCPASFEDALRPQLTLLEVFELRRENAKYEDLPEDQWTFYTKGNHDALLFLHEGSGELIIYATSKGQLYSSKDLFKAVETIKELKAREAKKIILPKSA